MKPLLKNKPLFKNKRYIVSILLTILMFFCTHIASYADITPVSERTWWVRNAIVDAVPGVDDADDVTAAHLAAITSLNLSHKSRSWRVLNLKAGDLDGLTALTRLSLGHNDLTALPSGIFDELTALTELDLSWNNLTALPAGVFDNNTKLEILRLNNNDLTALPADIFDNLTKLESLHLYGNGKQLDVGYTPFSLPSGIFDNNTELRYLDLGVISSLPAGIFDNLTKLESLHFGSNSLPSGIFNNLTALTHLGLNGNRPFSYLTALPSGIFNNLTALTHLDLSRNKLSSLSSGIFNNLTALTHLDLSHNDLRFFQPGLISRLTNLTTLDISVNDLTLLASGIFSHLTNLTSLNIRSNDLTRLPATIFSRLTNLTTLDISVNDLTSLPSGIFSGLTNLTQLTLGSDMLTTLPSGIFSDLTSLTNLRIYNNFTLLPSGIFSGPTNLTNLYVRSKLVGNLPLIVSLEEVTDGHFKAVAPAGAPFDIVLPLTVTNGSINGGATSITIPAGSMESEVFIVTRTPGVTAAGTVNIGTLPGIPSNHEGYTLAKSTDLPLEFTDTFTIGITPVCERTPQVRDAIVAAVPGINDCKDITEAHLAAITRLSLSWNVSREKITSLKVGDFSGLTSLEVLWLSHNSLTSLPEGIFNGLLSLKAIDLLYNNINSIPSNMFKGLTSLKRLDLQGNRLTSLSTKWFDDLSSLETLSFNGNSLTELPTNVFDRLTSLKSLNLSSNSLTSLSADVFERLSTLTHLKLRNASLTSLPTDIFDGLSSLIWLDIGYNSLTSLPDGIFDGLSSLTTLVLSGNTVNPMPLTVLLEKVGTDQFKAGAPAGAPFDIVLPVPVTSGSISGGASSITISKGTVESATLTVTRTPGTTAAVTVDIGTLPGLPSSHSGYALVKSTTDLPLTVIPAGTTVIAGTNNAPVFTDDTSTTRSIAENTAAGQHIGTAVAATDADSGDTLTYTLGGTDAVSFSIVSTTGQLQTKAALNYETKNAYSVTVSVSDGNGGTDSITVTINITDVVETTITPVSDRTRQVRDAIVAAVPGVNSANDVTEAHLAAITSLYISRFTNIKMLKVGDFSGLTALTTLDLSENQLSTLPDGIFDDLTALNTLELNDNQLSTLPEDIFGNLTQLQILQLQNNRLTTLPADIFDAPSKLRELFLLDNQLTTLPADVFNGLTALTLLNLEGNNLSTLPAGIFADLTDLNYLTLADNQLTTLPAGIFEGPSALWDLWLDGNRFTMLPAGIFKSKSVSSGFVSLRKLYLEDNTVDPLPLTVSLEKVTDGQFKAVAPAGAPFDIVLPLTVTNGSIRGGASSITISKGTVESETLTVTRTSGTTAAVTVNIGALPGIPSNHEGYAIRKSTTDLPLTVIDALQNSAPVFTDGTSTTRTIAENTASGQHIGTAITATDADNDTLTYTLGGTDAATFEIDTTTGQLKTKAALDYETKTTYTVTVTVSDGSLTDTITVTINVIDVNDTVIVPPVVPVASRTSQVRDAIVAAIPGVSAANQVTAAHLAAITNLNLRNAGITALQADDFSGMTALTSINLFNNQLISLPPGIFEGLTSLTTIRLGQNAIDPLPLTVSLEKVRDGTFKAVAPAGATFNYVLSITVTNGTINGGATTLTIPHGSTESGTLTVTRTAGTTGDVTVDIAALPRLPGTHYGYALTKSDRLPLIAIGGINTAPVFSDGTTATRSIAENTAAGQNIGTAITATDADNDTLTYTLGGTDASSFSILGTSGQLQTRAALDYETKNTYTVTVTVSDGSLTDTITVTINITDINELPTATAICKVGDVLKPGQSCTYPGTDAVFSVLGDGTAQWHIPNLPAWLEWINQTAVSGSLRVSITVNGQAYHFVAEQVGTSWEIKEIGDDRSDPQPEETSADDGTPTLAVSTAAPLTEATLHEGTVTLTLSGGIYESFFDVADAVSVSGINGVSFNDFFGLKRVSDTKVTIELEFNGNMTTDGTLTVTVGADGIKDYNGAALTAQLRVTANTESVAASTAAPLKEATLDGSVVTLTLNGAKYTSSVWDLRDGVSVSGIAGVTKPWNQPTRKSDTQITVKLEFDGDMKTDGTLTFTIDADAIAGYNGPDLKAQVSVSAGDAPVAGGQTPDPEQPEQPQQPQPQQPQQPRNTGGTPTLVVSTTSALTEATLDGGIVTLTLSGGIYESFFDVADAVSVSGINGVSFNDFFGLKRVSDTKVTIELEFNGNMTTDGTLTVTVGADGIKDYNGAALTAQLRVTANTESVAASTTAPLKEATLDGSVVTLTLSGAKYAKSIWDIQDAVSVSGISGVTFDSFFDLDRVSDTKVTIELEFDGDMTTDGTLTFTVEADAIAGYNGPALTAQITVTADRENVLLANFPNPFNPETWIPYQLAKPAEVTITIYAANGQLVRTLALGHQPDGFYYSRSRAAYWDGKNQFGEPVASGVYFYTLTAGDFTATRKMLIRK